jgi:hypothetical protein
MDIDENDLLSTNSFIRNPVLINNISNDANAEYINYFREKNIAQIENSIQEPFVDLQLDNPKQGFKETTTTIHIDSRDRDRLKYPKPNFFDIFLGKTFNFIKQIKLTSVEFPNTNAVINSTNNRLYWINQEDINLDIIDSITGYYPIYSVQLRIGSYFSDTLGSEMISKMNLVKRKNGTSDFHFFDITLDNETDIVSFTSLILKSLIVNPIQTLSGTGTIKVQYQSHGFSTGDLIYIIGAKTLAGINSISLNGAFNIIVINSNFFQYEINVNAADTLTGGGNTVKIGKQAPFQFLFGNYPFTVAPNIGFPLENSSEKINTFIKSSNPFFQVQVVLQTNHNFLSTTDYIGKTCTLSMSNTSPILDGTRVITQIINATTILISVNSFLDFPSFNNGTLTFNNIVYNVASFTNTPDAILIETFYNHNYTLLDVDSIYNITNTLTTPVLQGDYKITSVYSDTQFVIAGTILGSSSVSLPNITGFIPRHNPLISRVINITNVSSNLTNTIIYCDTNHLLKINQEIQIYNLITSPDIIKNPIKVIGIINATTFIVAFQINTVDTTTFIDAYFGTNILSLSFPNHGFNQIVSIYNGGSGTVFIDTILPHNLTTGSLIRLSHTNSVPSIDGSFIITYVDTDTFSISFPNITTIGTFGILGKSNDFFIYSSKDIGGISTTIINNNKFTVLDIVDINTFTFAVGNAFTNKNEIGGGDNVFISSLHHGFNSLQTNTKNDLLNRSINLQGENYAFLCCNQLSNMLNSGSVKDIFARITLDQLPNHVTFNFHNNPKTFDLAPLAKLDNLTFTVRNHDNTLYEFNDLDYSIALDITELISTSDTFNISSKYQELTLS